MEIKAGRVDVFASVGETHRNVRLVGTLVMGKSRVTIDAKHGTARWAGIGDEMWRNLAQWRRKIRDKPQDWLAHAGFPFFFVSQKPVAIIVALEAG